jgi:hypothetical protein
MSESIEQQANPELSQEENHKNLRLYIKPQLIELGDLRTKTLASSQGNPVDSGGSGIHIYVKV